MSPGGASVPQVVINSLEWQKLWMASTLCHSTSLQDKYPEEDFENMLKQRNNRFPSNLPPCRHHHHHPPLHCRQKLTCPTPWWWRVCERWLLRFDPVERPQALLAPPDVIQFEKDGPLNDKSDGDTLIIRLGLFTPSDHESACLSLILVFQIITFSLSESNADVASSSRGERYPRFLIEWIYC